MNYTMPRTVYTKAFIFLAVSLCLSATLKGAEDDVIRNIAEKFVRQIEEKDTDAILQSHPMTNEFRSGMPNAATVTEWAREIDRLFGRLGDVVNSEIVEHRDQGMRSVYLYYQGTKRPAKLWVTFSGTVIAGFHYDVWEEGYTDRGPTHEKSGRFAEWILAVVVVILIVVSVNLIVVAVAIMLVKVFHVEWHVVVIYGSFGILALALSLPVLLPTTGEEDPTVEIVDVGIKINDGYGLTIGFTEITGISLMENRIDDIELTWRTFGYATDTTLKGYFRSRKHGRVLLFTKTNSSPTIHIQRNGKADVFLNFSDNEATRTLYVDMKTAFER